MSIDIRTKEITLDEPKIVDKVTNDKFGLAVATEWKRLIGPYTPRDTGQLEDTATITPWTITYAPANKRNNYVYAHRIYHGTNFNFQTTHNPYATHHWDSAAEQAGKVTDLYNYINNVLLK